MPKARPLPKPPKGLDEGKIFREARDLALRRLRAVGPELISDQVFHTAFSVAKDRINRRIGEFHGVMANHFAGTGLGQSSFVTQIYKQSIRRAKEIDEELRIELETFRNRHNERVAAKFDRENRRKAGNRTGGESVEIDEDALLGPRKLADLFAVPYETLRGRLRQWRRTNHNGWIENRERAPREPQFVYKVGVVRPIIEGLKRHQRVHQRTTSEKK